MSLYRTDGQAKCDAAHGTAALQTAHHLIFSDQVPTRGQHYKVCISHAAVYLIHIQWFRNSRSLEDDKCVPEQQDPQALDLMRSYPRAW